MKKLIFAVICVASLSACSNGNLEYVKEHGEQRWERVGFKPVAYQGHQWGPGGMGADYGGAKVWWELRKVPDNGITYSGYLVRWGSDLEVHGPIARDAIKPN